MRRMVERLPLGQGEKMAERGLGKKTKTEKRNRDSGKRNDKRNK